MKITLLGLGMGAADTHTMRAREVLMEADAIIAAGRLLDSLPDSVRASRIDLQKPADILAWLKSHAGLGNVCIAFSGDIGFYSAAVQVRDLLLRAGYAVDGLSGISTAPYLCARLGIPWHDIHMVGAYGPDCDVLAHILNHETCFFLSDSSATPGRICDILCEAGLQDSLVSVAERLSYPDERIVTGDAARLADNTFSNLSSVLVRRRKPAFRRRERTPGIPSGDFIQGAEPVSSREARGAVLAMLGLAEDAIVYTVGEGSAPVAVEAALEARWGRVYAFLHDADACWLLRRNREHFGVYNLRCVEGGLPGAFASVPPPDVAYVSHTLENPAAVFTDLLHRNPALRIVRRAADEKAMRESLALLRARGLGGIRALRMQFTPEGAPAAETLYLLTASGGANPP